MLRFQTRRSNIFRLFQFFCITLLLLTGLTGCKPSNSASGNIPNNKPDNKPSSNPFKFIVFGDFNGGDCYRNDRVQRTINMMAKEKDIAFYVSTGDLIDGYVDKHATLCFASDPAETLSEVNACPEGIPNGNVAEMMAPLKNRKPVSGLKASFYPVIGNHDDNWGSNWYPDPCGDGICDFLYPLSPETYINHEHGEICSKDEEASRHSRDFYYSFTYENSYFIILRINNDNWTMLSSCNDHSGYEGCVAYCADPNNSGREKNCWGGIEQYDWLIEELEKAKQYENKFVFTHAVALGSGDGHLPFAGAGHLRKTLEQYGVDVFFNGHNHAYQRSHKVSGGSDRGEGGKKDKNGTVYLTVGSAGGEFNESNPEAWFSAKTYDDWVKYGEQGRKDKMTTYTIITVNNGSIKGDTKSIGVKSGSVDLFKIK
jgi:Calcineurin-like phosphoesterase